MAFYQLAGTTVELLNELFDNAILKQRLALKGGAALNLFYFYLPRLSVDIDLNYVGAVDRNTMIEERKELEPSLITYVKRVPILSYNK